ncbi:hypothetical protein FRB99_004940 [Tulasnella sp. 403]|nr:hypothetical protein FRB99_004940 [Tulasnella sp. 403]
MVYYSALMDIGSCVVTGTQSKRSVMPTQGTTTTQPTSSGTITATGNGWVSYANDQVGKYVIAHFMVGNAASYDKNQWLSEIKLAAAQGIDAFALNLGQQPTWQPDRMQDAYDMALASGTGFKMLISFDMTAISCSSWGDTAYLTNLINRWAKHGAQLKDTSGAVYVSTFAGEYCSWGQGSIVPGWVQAVKTGPGTAGVKTKFIPGFFTNASSNYMYRDFMDGMFPWNNGWPMGDYDTNWDPDAYDLQYVDRTRGQVYMAPVSPWFFTHYPPYSWNKNWIYRGDDHHYVGRWEQVIYHRAQVDLVEIVTWNDYGESSYIGPIGKDQPNSQAWVNGFPHNAWLTLTGYYAKAWKSGQWPTITKDTIYMWARPHGAADTAPDPSCGRPNNADWTSDKFWVILFATAPGQLKLQQGTSSSITNVIAGVNKLSLPSAVTNTGVYATLARNGVLVFSYFAPITFTHSPPRYNFNAFVFSGP